MGAEAAWAAVRERLLAEPDVGEGVAFASPNLNREGRIVAMRRGDDLVVKLPAARCAELVAGGAAVSFETRGRRMREWVAVGEPDPVRWTGYA